MEREQILRDDFPSARKGWDPGAVRAHLRAVADSGGAERGASPLADGAAERVRTVIAAAEELASEISADAQVEAERLLAEARGEAEQLLAEARNEADARVEQARAAVGSLVAQADELRTRVGTLGEELAGSIRSNAVPIGAATASRTSAEVPGPAVVPEPTPPLTPEPTPDPVPEPTPDPVPEPTPDPVPERVPDPTPPDPAPAPDLPDAPEPAPPAPEPEIQPPVAVSASASTDDLIAQLRCGSGVAAAANGTTVAPAVSGSDHGAARLVAMNMALDGTSRERIAAQLRTEFGDVADLDGMLDDVLARAGR